MSNPENSIPANPQSLHAQPKEKVTRVFSWPLMKQTFKSNIALAIVILIIMILMANVINFAMSILSSDNSGDVTEVEKSEAQQDFYTYLYVIASYDQMTGADLSWSDFDSGDDTEAYEQLFELMNAQQDDLDLSVEGFEDSAEILAQTDTPLETYIRQFEYVYALGSADGVFTGEELDIENFMDTMFETMGMSTSLMDTMETMDSTTLLNQMYFTVIGLLPILLFIVIVGNGVIASKVDQGSMAYVLSTPTTRNAVTFTQAVYLILMPLIMIAIVCATRIASSLVLFTDVSVARIIVQYLGMYLLTETLTGICFLGSCLFNKSRSSLSFGGGITVWCFLASLMGMFGSSTLVDIGIGVKALGVFNNLTFMGLYDISAIATIGTDAVDFAFVWKFIVLAVVAVVCYIIAMIRFRQKDLPL
ncbi:MAG: hypothetical protein LUB61_03980 [Eggerthellaceae bacterium]|nr:hypothetical protein [Eggerthellaceae bacterium]